MDYPQVVKDPTADLDYAFDWTAWLGNDTIVSSTWSVSGGGIQTHNASVDITNKIATVWLKGGVVDSLVTVTNRITTAALRADERSFVVKVQHR